MRRCYEIEMGVVMETRARSSVGNAARNGAHFREERIRHLMGDQSPLIIAADFQMITHL